MSSADHTGDSGQLLCPECRASWFEMPVLSMEEGNAFSIGPDADLPEDVGHYEFDGYKETGTRPVFSESGPYIWCRKCQTLLVHKGDQLRVADVQDGAGSPSPGLATVPIKPLERVLDSVEAKTEQKQDAPAAADIDVLRSLLADERNRRAGGETDA